MRSVGPLQRLADGSARTISLFIPLFNAGYSSRIRVWMAVDTAYRLLPMTHDSGM